MFNLTKIVDARINVPEPIMATPTTNEAISVGEALVLSAGLLTKASGTTKPTHIAMQASANGSSADIAVYKITPAMRFEVPVKFSATPNALVVGTKVTLHTDGVQVTDVTSSGTATIVDKLAADSTNGDIIVVSID